MLTCVGYLLADMKKTNEPRCYENLSGITVLPLSAAMRMHIKVSLLGIYIAIKGNRLLNHFK
jgi:hypothetical protein